MESGEKINVGQASGRNNHGMYTIKETLTKCQLKLHVFYLSLKAAPS